MIGMKEIVGWLINGAAAKKAGADMCIFVEYLCIIVAYRSKSDHNMT